MKTLRIQITAVLLILAGFAMVIPDNSRSSFALRPDEMIDMIKDTGKYITVDDIAREVVREDSTLQLVDVRNADQYLACHIPGAINLPLPDLLSPEY